eukprot:NODE_145_length_2504_cov_62.062684_g141_i0.p1 GENE.NODE_145_length_2504_cov_62.062684_g141_i0~~NODE_145_length_2504_cov_62.062684_g141_i0.p1  ORF type:complete len:819 (-),score=212.64 NODE_145_length_2504_cov_62.062684_g141_i0:46-2463(-)
MDEARLQNAEADASALQDAVAAAELQIKQLQTVVAAQLRDADAKVRGAEMASANYEQDVSSLEEQLGQMEEEMQRLRSHVQVLEDEKASRGADQDEVAVLRTQLQQKEQDTAVVMTAMEEQTAALSKMRKTNSDLMIAKAQAIREKETAEVELATVQAEVAAKSERKEAVKTDRRELESSLAAKAAEINRLTQQLSGLEATAATLSVREGQVIELERKLETQSSEFHKQVAELEAQLRIPQAQSGKLQQVVDELRSANATANTTIAELTTTITSQDKELDQLRADLTKQHETAAANLKANTTIAELEDTIADQDKEIADLQDALRVAQQSTAATPEALKELVAQLTQSQNQLLESERELGTLRAEVRSQATELSQIKAEASVQVHAQQATEAAAAEEVSGLRLQLIQHQETIAKLQSEMESIAQGDKAASPERRRMASPGMRRIAHDDSEYEEAMAGSDSDEGTRRSRARRKRGVDGPTPAEVAALRSLKHQMDQHNSVIMGLTDQILVDRHHGSPQASPNWLEFRSKQQQMMDTLDDTMHVLQQEATTPLFTPEREQVDEVVVTTTHSGGARSETHTMTTRRYGTPVRGTPEPVIVDSRAARIAEQYDTRSRYTGSPTMSDRESYATHRERSSYAEGQSQLRRFTALPENVRTPRSSTTDNIRSYERTTRRTSSSPVHGDTQVEVETVERWVEPEPQPEPRGRYPPYESTTKLLSSTSPSPSPHRRSRDTDRRESPRRIPSTLAATTQRFQPSPARQHPMRSSSQDWSSPRIAAPRPAIRQVTRSTTVRSSPTSAIAASQRYRM